MTGPGTTAAKRAIIGYNLPATRVGYGNGVVVNPKGYKLTVI